MSATRCVLGVVVGTSVLNWQGMPAVYGVGESFTLMVKCVLAFWVIDRVTLGKRSRRTA